MADAKAQESSTISWVEHVFPPKFKLQDTSHFKFSESKPQAAKHLREIYEDVYIKRLSANARPDDTRQGQESPDLHVSDKPVNPASLSFSMATKGPVQKDCHQVCKEDRRQDSIYRNNSKCIWSSQELSILRSTLNQSELNNIRLKVITKSLHKDCECLKKLCHEQSVEILNLKKKYNEVRKQNKRMKVICQAFQEDAKKSQETLEEYQNQLQVAVSFGKAAELEVFRTNKELEAIQKQFNMLELELEKEKILKVKLLENQKNSLSTVHARQYSALVDKFGEIQQKLKKERNDHALTKKALAHLRLHFAQ